MSRIRYGMVGGGPGAFIGAVHRMAAALDGELELVAGAFASTPERSRETGAALGVDSGRVYSSFQEMAEAESELAPEERIELVSVVTPNHLHHGVALSFLLRGFHVVCDKPLTTRIEDAEELCRISSERGLVFCVTYNYTGYPMVKEARERVRTGALGRVRKAVVEYSQGWLSTLLEGKGQKQAEWRTDPARGGPSSVLGDIGTHAYDLIRYVTGLDAVRLFADLGTVVDGRRVDDDATVLLELAGGERVLLFASQIATGERNYLRMRLYGTEGGLDWCQEDPNDLTLLATDGSASIVHTAAGDLSERTRAATRLPGGHPEGFVEAFANVYRNVARTIRSRRNDDRRTEAPPFADDFPTVRDGAHGVRFVHAAVQSHRSGGWVDCAYAPPG